MIPQEWFLCIFARTLPWPSVLRVCFFSVHLVMIMMVMAMLMQVWDMFCCEGVKVLFRVALVLIKHALPRKVHIIDIVIISGTTSLYFSIVPTSAAQQ